MCKPENAKNKRIPDKTNQSPRFTMIDEDFNCGVCGAYNPALGYTARDHCCECLASLHLDINPGDRMSECGGVLEPVGVEFNKKGCQIIYCCRKCGVKKKNIVARDDNQDLIIRISANPV